MNNSNALYNSLLKDAVNEKNKLTAKTLNKIIKIYESTADDLLKKASTSRGFTRAWTKDYERYIKYKILELNNELAKVSDSSIRTSAEIAASVQGDFLSYINNKYTLDIDKSMLEFAYTTNEKLIGQIIHGGFYKDNRSLSDRIWGYGNQNGKDIQYILTKGMAEQKSYLDIIKDLEKFLKSNTDPDFKKTYTKLYNRKVDYNAQRLLRTAMNHMFYVQNVSNAKNNPYAEAMHWELSAEHGTRQVDRFGEDECDDYANSDYYNLGQGNFPPDKVPVPHPNCLCIQTIVIPKSLEEIGRELGEWINGKDISYLDEWLKVG